MDIITRQYIINHSTYTRVGKLMDTSMLS